MALKLDIFIQNVRRREEFVKNLDYFLKKIKEVIKSIDKGVKIILFGSYLSNDFSVASSDIDILIVTKKDYSLSQKAKIVKKINENIGSPNPFEFHIVSEEEFKNWYSKFIKKYKIV